MYNITFKIILIIYIIFRESLNSFMSLFISMVVTAFVIKQLFQKYVKASQSWGALENQHITLCRAFLTLFYILKCISHFISYSTMFKKNKATINKLELR